MSSLRVLIGSLDFQCTLWLARVITLVLALRLSFWKPLWSTNQSVIRDTWNVQVNYLLNLLLLVTFLLGVLDISTENGLEINRDSCSNNDLEEYAHCQANIRRVDNMARLQRFQLYSNRPLPHTSNQTYQLTDLQFLATSSTCCAHQWRPQLSQNNWKRRFIVFL